MSSVRIAPFNDASLFQQLQFAFKNGLSTPQETRRICNTSFRPIAPAKNTAQMSSGKPLSHADAGYHAVQQTGRPASDGRMYKSGCHCTTDTSYKPYAYFAGGMALIRLD